MTWQQVVRDDPSWMRQTWRQHLASAERYVRDVEAHPPRSAGTPIGLTIADLHVQIAHLLVNAAAVEASFREPI